jgi:hypothetical protein
VVFVAAYLVALFSLLESRRDRSVLIAAGLLIVVYAVLSYSTLALALLLLGVGILAWEFNRPRVSAAVLSGLLAVVAVMLWLLRKQPEFLQKYTLSFGAVGGLPENVASRIRDWSLHANGILESPHTALFGHRDAFERAVSTSAHNYYLDFLYNFGAVAFLPLLVLIVYTGMLMHRQRKLIFSERSTLGLTFVVVFLILVDNNFKVSLRQPYPGVFSFFLWGLLLSRLTPGFRKP